jgi:hypothetical protein
MSFRARHHSVMDLGDTPTGLLTDAPAVVTLLTDAPTVVIRGFSPWLLAIAQRQDQSFKQDDDTPSAPSCDRAAVASRLWPLSRQVLKQALSVQDQSSLLLRLAL